MTYFATRATKSKKDGSDSVFGLNFKNFGEWAEVSRTAARLNRGAFHFFEKVYEIFRTKGFADFDGFFLKTKGLLPKVFKIFWDALRVRLEQGQLKSSKSKPNHRDS